MSVSMWCLYVYVCMWYVCAHEHACVGLPVEKRPKFALDTFFCFFSFFLFFLPLLFLSLFLCDSLSLKLELADWLGWWGALEPAISGSQPLNYMRAATPQPFTCVLGTHTQILMFACYGKTLPY